MLLWGVLKPAEPRSQQALRQMAFYALHFCLALKLLMRPDLPFTQRPHHVRLRARLLAP